MPRCEPWIADDRFQLGYEQGNLTVPCPGRGLGKLAREICRRSALDIVQPPHQVRVSDIAAPDREEQVVRFKLDAHGSIPSAIPPSTGATPEPSLL
jgi:hypothetical protein